MRSFLHSVLAETICGYLRYFVCLVWSLIQYKNTDGFSIIKVHQRAGILPTIMPKASYKFVTDETDNIVADSENEEETE